MLDLDLWMYLQYTLFTFDSMTRQTTLFCCVFIVNLLGILNAVHQIVPKIPHSGKYNNIP
jgi:hypothetical protein